MQYFFQCDVSIHIERICTWKLCFSLAEWSEMERKERKENPFLSAEVCHYHFEAWGAVVCCMFLFVRFAKIPHSFSWWTSWGRPSLPPFEFLKKQKFHADVAISAVLIVYTNIEM